MRCRQVWEKSQRGERVSLIQHEAHMPATAPKHGKKECGNGATMESSSGTHGRPAPSTAQALQTSLALGSASVKVRRDLHFGPNQVGCPLPNQQESRSPTRSRVSEWSLKVTSMESQLAARAQSKPNLASSQRENQPKGITLEMTEQPADGVQDVSRVREGITEQPHSGARQSIHGTVHAVG